MPRATAVWLVENTTLTFRQISDFCEIHELEIQAIADGDVASNIMGLSPIDNNQLTWEEIHRCEADASANLVANPLERNVKEKNAKAKKMLSPSQRNDKPSAIAWVIKNYPQLSDSQICKLIGTTKPTIEAIRNGTHRESANIRPKNPVIIGLTSEKELDEAISLAQARLEKANAPKKKATKKKATKKTAKKAVAKKTTKKTTAKKAKEKAAVKKAPKKAAKKTAPKKAAKKATTKKTSSKKKTAAKKKTTKKAAE